MLKKRVARESSYSITSVYEHVKIAATVLRNINFLSSTSYAFQHYIHKHYI